MKGLERRQTPRTTMERHAYINIEPNNGGIVLNVSEGGLCFHSFDPVQPNGTIRFWFSDNNQRIEADGSVTWTDETQKGGLRFTALPPEAREQIRKWMSHPTPLAADEGSTREGSPLRAFPILSDGRPDREAAPAGSAPLAVVPSELRVPIPLSGFSRGLATGLLVSAVVAAAFLFQSYRREIGESLIQLGQRFAAKPEAQTLTVSAAAPPAVVQTPQVVSAAKPSVSPAPQAVSPATPTASPAPRTVPPAAALIPAPQPEKVLPQPEKTVAEPVATPSQALQAKLEPAKLATTIPTAASDPVPEPRAPATVPAISSTSPAVSSRTAEPTAAVAPSANLIPSKPAPAPKPEAASQPGVHSEDSKADNADAVRELYFEVGKFKSVSQAHDETDKLAQLGFPATAVEKGHIWANSFHVLVGPYGDEDKAKETHENLVTSGFKPRPFEKGSRNFTLMSSLTLNGARTPVGDYTISWESYIGDASVKFIRNSFVVATAGGRWVKHDVKYQRDAYVYRRNADGSRTLLEIHFGGMRQALVFGKSS
jgi:hypothetical protein